MSINMHVDTTIGEAHVSVCVVATYVSREQLEGIIKCLNENELEGWRNPDGSGEQEELLTIEEVLANPKLRDYLCGEAVEDGIALYDPHEFWNNDGWCDLRDYR